MRPLITSIKHGKVMNPDVGISTRSWTALLGITELGSQSICPDDRKTWHTMGECVRAWAPRLATILTSRFQSCLSIREKRGHYEDEQWSLTQTCCWGTCTQSCGERIKELFSGGRWKIADCVCVLLMSTASCAQPSPHNHTDHINCHRWDG